MGVDSTQRLVANALFQPLYSSPAGNESRDDTDKASECVPPNEVPKVSEVGADKCNAPTVCSSDCGNDTIGVDTKADDSHSPTEKRRDAHVKVGSMMIHPSANVTMRNSFVFHGEPLKRSLLITVSMHTSNRMKVWLGCEHLSLSMSTGNVCILYRASLGRMGQSTCPPLPTTTLK